MPDALVSAVPHAGAVLRQCLCIHCGHLIYVPAGYTAPCAWCSSLLLPVLVAGESVVKCSLYASYMR